MLLYHLEIAQETGTSERRLGAGSLIVGGGLTADLVVPALIDNELCELILPSTSEKPIKLTALVEGLIVNGRELKRGQAVSASQLEFSADGVVMRVGSAIDEAEAVATPPPSPQERLAGFFARARKGRDEKPQGPDAAGEAADSGLQARVRRLGVGGVGAEALSAHPAIEKVRSNPAFPLVLLALLLGLIAFMISGWPSARFNAPQLAGLGAEDRNGAFMAELRRRLVAADLAGVVKADAFGGGIRLTGIVDANQAQRLGDIVKTISRPGVPTIANEVTMASIEAATGIEAVLHSPTKGVVVTGGRLFREGQSIPSGWLIERIEPEQVRLKRDEMNFVLAMPKAAAMPSSQAVPARALPVIAPSVPATLPAKRGFEPVSSAPSETQSEKAYPQGGAAPPPHRPSQKPVISK